MTTRARPNWDEYFMEIAQVVASRSTCLRRQIGALIVKDKHILATGYNGSPSGLPHCLDIGCLRDELGIASGTRHEICRALHSEQNAIMQAALHGTSTKDATIYCTHQPCSLCAKAIISSGITRVVYEGDYPDTFSLEMLNMANIELIRFERNNPPQSPLGKGGGPDVSPLDKGGRKGGRSLRKSSK